MEPIHPISGPAKVLFTWLDQLIEMHTKRGNYLAPRYVLLSVIQKKRFGVTKHLLLPFLRMISHR
jgi:hypothetical protein